MSESEADVISCGSLSLCGESGTAAVQGMHHMMGSEAVTQLNSDTDRQTGDKAAVVFQTHSCPLTPPLYMLSYPADILSVAPSLHCRNYMQCVQSFYK